MESAVVTVSGYHGLERFNLIKLISHAGASYVGSLSQSTTHLICWRFEGRKYKLAKKLKTIIVNHRWIEDCIKEGKRLPEDPYMLQSGEQMGPFLMQIHDIAKGVMADKHEVLSDNSNGDNNDVIIETNDVRYEGLSGWSKSALLDENLFPRIGEVRGYSHKLKCKSFGRDLKCENWSGRNCSEGTSSSGSARKERGESSSYTSMSSVKNKRKKFKESNVYGSTQSLWEERIISNGKKGNPLADSSQRKGRRLVKNFTREIVVSDLSDSDQECCLLRVHKENSGVVHPSDISVDRRNANLSEVGRPSTDDFSKHRGVGEEKNVDVIKSQNHQSPSKDSIFRKKDDGSGSSPDGSIDAEKGSQDVNLIELGSRSLNSEESSCAICLMEFSSTIGFLPCVHRFCFSCIQKWAVEMASRKKTPTCPLCLQGFISISKVEDADVCDKKKFCQTIPCAMSTTDFFILCDEERPAFGAQFSSHPVCINCRSREPEDLLVGCHHCQLRYIHEYCLDPPLFPWTCIHCKDIERLRLSTHSFY